MPEALDYTQAVLPPSTHTHMSTLPHFEYMPTVFQTSTLNKGSSPVYFYRRKCMNRMGGWVEPERTDVPQKTAGR